jgi:hypothetical protein
MHHPRSTAIRGLRRELTALRGLWPGVEADLHSMGYSALADLRGKDPGSLASDYCRRLNRPADPLLRPWFTSIVRFAETGTPTPWWHIVREEPVVESESMVG